MKPRSFFSLMAFLDSISLTQHVLFQHGKHALHTELLSGSSLSPKLMRFQTPVSGVGNGSDLEDVSKGC